MVALSSDLAGVLRVLDNTTWADGRVFALLEVIDTDNDALISISEFIAWLSKVEPSTSKPNHLAPTNHTLLRIADDVSTIEVELNPGKAGLKAKWSTGFVTAVSGGEALRCGVEKGWIFSRSNGEPYTEDLFDMRAGARPYRITFLCPHENECDAADITHGGTVVAKKETDVADSTHASTVVATPGKK